MNHDEDERERLGRDRTVLSDASPDLRQVGTTQPATTDPPPPLPTELSVGETLRSAGQEPAGAPGELRIGQRLAGKYELVRVLGQGGMGKVWRGIHHGLGVPIAIKTMHPEIAASTDYVRRFRREAHAASVLSHPNVVRVLDFGDDHGTLYMVMELLEGRSLTLWLARHGKPPPLVEVADVMSQLLDAFELAHSYGIVHRDLKPDNVFLTEGGGKHVVKVVDFGLAHVEDKRDQGPTLTAKDVVAGTPEYMSPEQCRSLAVGPSADIYSIGCLLTEMLQLRPPFMGASSIEVLAKQMFSPPPPLVRPEGAEPVPPLLERLRIDLLAKAPEKRPKTAAEVKARLLEAMSREATMARLPTRKGDEPLGDRAGRAPSWDQAEPPPATTRSRPRAVGVMKLADEVGGITSECETGLVAHKIEVFSVRDLSEIQKRGLAVLVVDAGRRVDDARALLSDLSQKAPMCRAIVCAAQLDTERMNDLVGAGAADVVRYPVTPDALSRKIDRVLKRGR
jgi:eukaryotic-like serine/threonine-protein kinase